MKPSSQGHLPDHEPQTTAYHTALLSSEPSPNINLWNHKVITKLFSIFLLKTPYWRMSLNWNRAYVFLRTTVPGLQNFLWTPAEPNLYFIDMTPRLRHSSWKEPCFSWSRLQSQFGLPFRKVSHQCFLVSALKPPFLWQYPSFCSTLLIRLFSSWSLL